MNDYDSALDTKAHQLEVARTMGEVCQRLLRRADSHDESKLGPVEKPIFDRVTPELKGLTYGSKEYKRSLASMGKALDHHYAHNSHHPEFYELQGKVPLVDGCGPAASMDLIDIVEMYCDWYAATQRHADGDIAKSIKHNKDRFKMSDELTSIFANTALNLGHV